MNFFNVDNNNVVVESVRPGVSYPVVTLPVDISAERVSNIPNLFRLRSSSADETRYLYIRTTQIYRQPTTYKCLYFSLPDGTTIDEDFPGVRLLDVHDASSVWMFDPVGVLRHYCLIGSYIRAIDPLYADHGKERGIICVQVATDDDGHYGAFFLGSDSIYKSFSHESIDALGIVPDVQTGGSFFGQDYDSGTSNDSRR
jgi:hypothetical protein